MNPRIAPYRTAMASLLFVAGLSTASANNTALVAVPPAVTAARGGVVPLSARPAGKSYGEWSVAYWQWAMSIPYANSPWANDYTGEFAAVGQGGRVWFLGGTLGDSATRDFTMPSGKFIFMPVHQWLFGATIFDCEPSIPGVTCDVPTLRAAADAAADGAVNLEVSIDGVPVIDPANYRVISPSSFSVTLPEDSVVNVAGGLDLDAGTYAPHVSDGYYLMLSPLTVGTHVITVHAENPGFGILYDIVYTITVEPQGIK